MMGAILHTINVRLSKQQILYTINHADDDILLVNKDFIPLINKIYSQFNRPIQIVILNDSSEESEEIHFQSYALEYEDILFKNNSKLVLKEFTKKF